MSWTVTFLLSAWFFFLLVGLIIWTIYLALEISKKYGNKWLIKFLGGIALWVFLVNLVTSIYQYNQNVKTLKLWTESTLNVISYHKTLWNRLGLTDNVKVIYSWECNNVRIYDVDKQNEKQIISSKKVICYGDEILIWNEINNPARDLISTLGMFLGLLFFSGSIALLVVMTWLLKKKIDPIQDNIWKIDHSEIKEEGIVTTKEVKETTPFITILDISENTNEKKKKPYFKRRPKKKVSDITLREKTQEIEIKKEDKKEE